MSTITKERIANLLQFNSEGSDCQANAEQWEVHELARIALASIEAEPAYFINRVKHSDAYGEDVELRTYCYELDALKSKDDFGGEVVPVYAAAPAPVSVPDEVSWEDVPEEITEDDMALASAWAHGFNQCRAAILQGKE